MNSNEVDGDLVSVALCTFNGAKYLGAQLESILNQSYRHLEIVICDDCSEDDSVEIIEHYQRCDSRITLIKNQQNIGFVQNFRQALSRCNGRLIALADQDDIWLENKIHRLTTEIGDNWLIYSAVGVIDRDGRPIARDFPRANRLQGRCALSLMMANSVIGHASLIRSELRDLALPFMSQMPYHDQWLGMVAASLGKLKASPEKLSLYRLHENNAVFARKNCDGDHRGVRVRKSIQGKIAFFEAVLASRILPTAEAQLAEEFLNLYRKNMNTLYNWRLKRFLKRNRDVFMASFKKPDKQIRKFCRGIYFYDLFPFA